MNETLKVLESRRSCRAFKADMIPEEDLQAILRAGTYSPTGKGMQNPVIITITNKDLRDRIAAANAKIGGWEEGFDPFYGAPIILMVIVNKKSGTPVEDGSLVMGNLMNAAESLGYGSCWIHRCREELESELGQEILKLAGLEGEYIGVGHCALGYAAAPAKAAAERKDTWLRYIK